MNPKGKRALFDFVRGGKGFIVTHSARDAFYIGNGSSLFSVGEVGKKEG
jgi:hypothetical protein